MAHTPGDWVVQHEFDDEPAYVVVNPAIDGTTIAELPVDEHIPWQERLANARLIAAAPRLHAFVHSRAAREDKEARELLAATTPAVRWRAGR